MTKNIGGIDRIIRIVIGLALLAYAVVLPDTGYNVWGFVGIIPLGTALLGWCPPYQLLGFSSCKMKTED